MFISIDRFEAAVSARVADLAPLAGISHEPRAWQCDDHRVMLEPRDPNQGTLLARHRDYAPSWTKRVAYDSDGVDLTAQLVVRALAPWTIE